MATQPPPPYTKFLAPRYWPTWLELGALFVVAWLPLRWRLAVGSALGQLTYAFGRERRYITEVNIGLCFPELDKPSQQALVKRSFIENGRGFIETTTSWLRPPQHFRDLLIISGAEHMEVALAQRRGVLLLGAHFSTLNFAANILSLAFPFGTTYRPHGNPLFDAFMLRGRLRHCNGVFDRYDIRGAFRHLKQGKILWYAPDQDYGPEQSVYSLFFGRPAATITATMRFAEQNKSPVVMIRHHRLPHNNKYVLEFTPVTPPFPTGDTLADATRINQMLEANIRMDPAQYLWMHKRFKTQVYGKPQSPYIFIRTRKRKLNASLYEKLITNATPLPDTERLQLASGLQLWHFAGVPSRWRAHPLSRLDDISKRLRAAQVLTVTVDNLFLLPFLTKCAATCHIPRGEALTTADASTLPPARAAQFLARIHELGLHFTQLSADNLLLHNNRLALLNPLVLEQAKHLPAGPRLRDLNTLMEILAYNAAQQAQCQQEYLRHCPASVAAGLLPAPRPQKASA